MSRTIVSCGIALTMLMGGCAGNRAALRSENSRLQAEVIELRAERRHDRRSIRDMERQLVLEQRDRRPSLPVEVAEPPRARQAPPAEVAPPEPSPATEASEAAAADALPDEAELAYADDDVEIVYVGEAAKEESVRPSIKLYEQRGRDTTYAPKAPVPVARARSGDRIPVTRGKVPPLPREAKRADPRDLYKQYYEALRAGHHEEAIAGLRAFVSDYPGSDLADNAQYWLAEAYYDQRQYDRALAEFMRVEKLFPKGNKIADALLKSAFCHQQLGAIDTARSLLGKVIERFPKTNAAAIAADRLVKLQADE